MQNGLDYQMQTVKEERKERRKKILLALLAVFLLFCFTLCIRTTKLAFIPPKQELTNLYWMIRLWWAKVTDSSLVYRTKDIIDTHPFYEETVGRFRVTITTVICGAILPIAGSVYQSVFRNPIAVPSMLGVTAGVDLGLILTILLYSTSASMHIPQAAMLCYAMAFLVLIIIIAFGRFLGGKKFSVVEMLLAGSLLTRIIADLVTLIQKTMTQDELEVLQEFTMYGFGISGKGAVIWFAIPILAAFIPLYMLRFSLNASAFPQGEAKVMGMNTFWLNLVAVICSTFLSVSALMFVGNVSMMALIIPYICRAMFGIDFRDQMVSCMIFGAGLLLICRIGTIAAFYSGLTRMFTLGTVVTLITTPLFMILIRRAKKGWT